MNKLNKEAEPLLCARNLTKIYDSGDRQGIFQPRKKFRAVDDVSFELHAARTLGIVGESGSGKSTTARIVAKLVKPSSGTIELEGRDVTLAAAAELKRFRRDVQVVFQDPYSSLNPRHNVEQIISAPLRYQGISAPQGNQRLVKDLLDRVGLNPDHSARYPSQFSGGQAQRIGIARAIALNPKIVICDEAVSALDVSVQAQVIDLLMGLQSERGFSYIFIAHDLAVVRQIAHTVCVMNGGRVVESGLRDEIFGSPQEEYTRQLLAASPVIPAEWEARRAANRVQEREFD